MPSLSQQTIKKTLLAHALTVAFGFAVTGIAVQTEVMAQSNATGSIFGRGTPGTNVQIVNNDTGLKRSVTVDSAGRYQATSLPIGSYKVTSGSDTRTIDVTLGQGSEVSFVAAGIQTVQVSGTRKPIDISTTTGGASFSARQLENLPVAKSVEAIVQLAPNTTRGDSRFNGNGASFGGGAVTENSYYINGFPVVNPLTGFGSAQLPFGAIAEANVLTGGFGAEFGRSVGGVVNVITKTGKNKWEAGVNLSITPQSLRATSKDLYYENTGHPSNTGTDNTVFRVRNQDTSETKQLGAYVGGPIIQDKLFMFVAAEQSRTDFSGTNTATGTPIGRTSTSASKIGWLDRRTTVNRALAKFDWNLTDNHRLEFMSIIDSPEVKSDYSGFVYGSDKYKAEGARNYTVTSSRTEKNINDNGNQLNALKYIGNITEDLTLTAMYGKATSKHTLEIPGYNPAVKGVLSEENVRAPGMSYNDPQPVKIRIPGEGSQDVVKSARLDLEWKLGQHTIRGGLDKSTTDTKGGDQTAGGGTWTYLKTDKPNEPIKVSGGEITAPAVGGGLGTQGYYVSMARYSDITQSYGEQSAFYLEDKFQITPTFMLVGGIRSESYSNKNKNKEEFLSQKNQINPRLAFSWDVNGDASLKAYGTVGRYSVGIPTNIGLRAAGATFNATQYYTYSSTDSNGQPQGLVELSKGPISPNGEYGLPRDPKTFTTKGMKPTYQDEITLGLEKLISPELNMGGRFTYRTLRSTIDDVCDNRPFLKWAAKNNTPFTNPEFLNGSPCMLFNPGRDNTFVVDMDGKHNYKEAYLTAADMGFEKAIRTYTALDVFFEHPLRNGWYGKVNYTWSRNYGNTEGQVRSDNAQADVSVTAVWDYPELMRGAEGLLPNDRTHQIKAFGFLQVDQEWSVGANLLLATGRPRSCLGNDPEALGPNYNNQAFFCGGLNYKSNVLVPRGKVGRLPWDKRLDLNVTYKPNFLKGLGFRVDVFNVTDEQTLQNVIEGYNANSGNTVSANYGRAVSYTAPRSVRLTAEYNHKF